MSLEAMKQVTEAEEANRARRAEAQAEAKRLVAEAERAGKARLAEARAQAEAQARVRALLGVNRHLVLRQAEAKAAEHASEVMAQTRKSCDALRAQAEARLADAAESIVRRVVKTNVHC